MEKVPVLLIGFNRPKETNEVFQAIRLYKPTQLFFAVDGPRKSHPNDTLGCEETKQIIDQVDWECNVQVLFSTENLGCNVAIPKALHWFFSMVNAGVILEDDCVPSLDFFKFMEKALLEWQDEKDIYHINGSNFFPSTDSFWFKSNIPICWGWGTWAKKWHIYQADIVHIESDEEHWLKIFKRYLPDAYQIAKWKSMLLHMKKDSSIWDYRWIFSIWKQGGVAISPSQNLIENIGIGTNASHAKKDEGPRESMLRRKASTAFFTSFDTSLLLKNQKYDRKLAYLLNPAQPWHKQTKFWIGEFLRKIRRKSAF